MNERTLRILEFPKIIERLAELTTSGCGRELALELAPLSDPALVREALQITSEAVKVLTISDRIPLGGFHDIRAALHKAAAGGTLGPEQLLEIASTARAARLMREFILEHQEGLEVLPEWAGRLAVFPVLEREIERAVGPGGEVLDGASSKLHSLRSQQKVAQNRIREKLDSLIHSGENAKYLQETIITLRSDRYVIPVRQEYRQFFPGIVHDHSSSGATLFIEPMAVVELSNKLRELAADEREEIERILRELSGRVREAASSLEVTVAIMARLDLAFAKGRYSLAIRGMEPELNSDGFIRLYLARHPLLPGKVVPIDVVLGQKFDTLVITGPNTGGKTVTLKTIGLLTLMAHAGLHIPAEMGSSIALFEQVFCDIGDEQSIEQSLSTFSSHLTQIVAIIKTAQGPESLVLLDELGAGTDPDEGAALAMSILTHLHGLGVRTVATTHYSELKAFAFQTDGIENAAVEFDVATLRPTYHLQIGLPGGSQAFAIAAKLGLSAPLIEAARSYLSSETRKVDTMLHEIEQDRRKARDDQQTSTVLKAESERLKNQYEQELAKLRQEKAELLRQAKAEAREVLQDARRESENLLKRLREGRYEELPEIVNEARSRFTQELERMEERPQPKRKKTTGIKSEELKPGMAVRAVELEQSGTVLEVGGNNALVQLGIMKVSLPLAELEILQESLAPIKLKHGSGNTAGLETAQHISAEISLRGMTVDDALYELEKYLDQAILAGLHKIRVIHGKGTGVLRQAVQEFLRGHPVVKSAVFAEQNEGGLGATTVELKK
jgi:DNA mismatch repair protein MutS2